MQYRFILALLAISALYAQTPAACISQPIPIKPIGTAVCSNATPVCLTDPNGLNGKWIWSCNAQSQPQIDPAVLQGIMHPATPQINNPIDTLIKAQQLRQLRLQNQQLEQQIQGTPETLQPLSIPQTPAELVSTTDVPLSDGNNWKVMKDFEKSMALWHRIKPTSRTQRDALQAMDRFYSDPNNISVPVDEAFIKVLAAVK